MGNLFTKKNQENDSEKSIKFKPDRETGAKSIISEKPAYNILILIFRRTSDFLDANDSLKLLCLSRFFYQHLPNNEFYHNVSKSLTSWIANFDRSDPDILDHFAAFLGRSPFHSYEDLYNCIKSSQNMIKNPCGEQGFEYWRRLNGGNGWDIEDWGCYKHKKTIFCSSYEWCSLTQTIKLPITRKKKLLIIGSHVSRRDDCGGLAKLDAVVYNKNHKRADSYKIDEVQIPLGEIYHLKLKIEIQPYNKEVTITYHGKDTNWWAGNYGARFGYCYARLFNDID